MAVAEMLASLTSNPYFGAGFGLIGVGSGLAVAKQAAALSVAAARRRYLVTLEIPSRDKSFGWFMEWMATHDSVLHPQHLSAETAYTEHENGEVHSEVTFVPAVGDHFFRYGRRWIMMKRTREKNVIDLTSGSLWETVQLTMIGRERDKRVLFELLDEARVRALQREEGKTVIYTTSSSGDWRRFGTPRRRRPLGSVVLAAGAAERLVGDVKDFLANANWYRELGIPYRRGYLLHGPPGCGKSSFVTALAGELGLNICILNLASKEINDDLLNQLMNFAPQRSIILLEDIDAAIARHDYAVANRITFSGLLNAIDGAASQEGRVLFMTTNYIDRLDPALIRPGRVDVQQFVGRASATQAAAMFEKFYPDATPGARDAFVARLPDDSVSMAALQGFLLEHRNSAEDALASVDALLDAARATDAHERAHVAATSAAAAAAAPSSADAAALMQQYAAQYAAQHAAQPVVTVRTVDNDGKPIGGV